MKIRNTYIDVDIAKRIPRTRVNETALKGTGKRYKLVVWRGDVSVKIEVTPVLRGSLQETLPELVRKIDNMMSDRDRRFLLSFKQGTQDWQEFPLPEVQRLPAVQWKMSNLARMLPAKRRKALEAVLYEQKYKRV